MSYTKEDLHQAYIKGAFAVIKQINTNFNLKEINKAQIGNPTKFEDSFEQWFYKTFVNELKDK